MDRGLSRSLPYLPRYHSVSPARSPQMGRRRFTSLRSVSQPSQRIFYIDNAPTRVVNSYSVSHSPSPHRSYTIHLYSSKPSSHLKRTTRSKSAHNLNSSHLYTSQEDLFDKSFKEAAARQVGSCEDIYHKGPFFPDVTPSESGVSVGESEEGSIFGGEDDNISQHSFDSSSAFYEVTQDSEFERFDSDNFSGPDSVNYGDRTLDILYEDDLDEGHGRRRRGLRRPSRELQSPDSSRASPLSYAEARRRELMSSPSSDFDKTHSRYQALRVNIPGHESSAKSSSKDQSKFGDKKQLRSTSPLAQSTPHVSPRGTGEPRMYVTASWDADDPFREANNQCKIEKSKAARALFDLDITGDDVRHSRLEESSCNSSCSEDNFSDISNATISSPTPRKTKLVKKASDRPASGKASIQPNVLGTSDRDNAGNVIYSVTPGQNLDRSSHNVEADNTDAITSGLVNTDSRPTVQTSKSSPNDANDGQEGEGRKDGAEWWAVYNIGAAKEREEERETSGDGNVFNFERDIRIVKPLKVNIPLISPGKQGQEKLRKFSQTSPPRVHSPPKSPDSPSSHVQTWNSGKSEDQITDHRNTNKNSFEDEHGPELGELTKFDHAKYHSHSLKGEEEEKHGGRNLSTALYGTNEKGVSEVGEGESSLGSVLALPKNESSFQSQVHKRNNANSEEMLKSIACANEGKTSDEKGKQFDSKAEIDSSRCMTDSRPSHQTSIYSLPADEIDNVSDTNSKGEVSRPADIEFVSRTVTDSLAWDEVKGPTSIEGAADHSNDQRRNQQLGLVASDDENDRAQGNSRHYQLGNSEGKAEGVRRTSDKFRSSSTLPEESSQVSEEQNQRDAVTASVAGTNNQLVASVPGKEEGVPSLSERGVNSENTLEVSEGHISQHEDTLKDRLGRTVDSVANSAKHGADKLAEPCCDRVSSDIDYSEKTFSESTLKISSNSDNSCDSGLSHLEIHSESSHGNDVIDSENQKNAIDDNTRRLEQEGLRESPQDLTQADLELTGKNTNMENIIDPRLAGRGGQRYVAECRETPQMFHVVATAQRIGDADEEINNINSQKHRSAFSPPNQQNFISQNHATIDSDTFGNRERDDFSFQHDWRDFSTNDFSVSGSDTSYNRFGQQESFSSDFSKDISKPVVDESIKPSGGSSRCDKGIPQYENLSGVNDGASFVERGEQFIHIPTSPGKQLTITETSSKHVKHVHRTTIEKVVTTERRINRPSSQVVSSSADSSGDIVDIVTDTSTTETVIKEDDDYITTTTRNTLLSDASCPDAVSFENKLSYTDTHCLSAATTSQPTPTLGQGSGGAFHPVSTQQFSSSSSPVSTTRSAAQAAAVDPHMMRGKGDSWDHKTSVSDLDTSGRVGFNDSEGRDFIKPRQDLTSSSNTLGSVMHQSSPLDSLQAQLSQISGDHPSSQSSSEVSGGYYHDHAEATSVLKQIVRGDTSDFTNFSKSSTKSVKSSDSKDYDSYTVSRGDTITKPGESVTDHDNDNKEQAEREQYDNDYDNVTTDLPKGSKHTSRSHHHIQLLKPGQLKASSLWTLQEETESLLDGVSPKPSPKRSLVTVASEDENSSHQSSPSPPYHTAPSFKDQWGADENDNIKNSRASNSAFRQRNVVSESSDFDQSDGNYSSISTPESSRRSSSYGRERTPLSETDSVPLVIDKDRMDYQDIDDVSQSTNVDQISSFQEFVTGLEGGSYITDSNSHVSVTRTGGNEYTLQSTEDQHVVTSSRMHTTSLAVSLDRPEHKDISDSSSILDNLSASLEQFNTSGFVSAIEDKSFSVTKGTYLNDDTLDISNSSTMHSWNEDAASEASSRLHALDLDLSRISSCASPTPSDVSESSMYKCTGTAEIKKRMVSFDYDIPSVSASTPKISLKSAVKKSSAVENRQDELHRAKMEQFEKLLNEFNKSTCPTEEISELIFLEDKRADRTDSPPSNYDDMYKAFTNDDSEKKQNHVCIVVEDENMNTFRFKRFLKKSHTKRKKGKKVMKFLSKLGCVSETVRSPESSPQKRMKHSDQDAHSYSTDSMPSPKHRISNPVLISSTSFHHHKELLQTSPQKSVKEGTPSSSNQSLDSFRSRADSAYSSISESALGSLSSPTSQRLSSTSTGRFPTVSSGSVSSVFHSGSVSGDKSLSDSAYSTSSDPTHRSFSTFSEADSTLLNSPLPEESQSSSMDNDMLSALSDVFDQLNVCEDEIDTALLSRMRHGHTQADVHKK